MTGKCITILKKAGITALCLPVLLVLLFIIWELFGMCVNLISTEIQTNQLYSVIKEELPDAEIIHKYSETGNTSGTGNHVDSLSAVILSADLDKEQILERLRENDDFSSWYNYAYIDETDTGYYIVKVVTSAPFVDNIMGH